MKQRPKAPAAPAVTDERPVWAAYAIGFLCFAAGLAFLVAGRPFEGCGLSLVGILAVTAGYHGPTLPWGAWWDGLRALSVRGRGPSGAAPARAWSGRGADPLANLLSLVGEEDTWSVSRLFLLGPVILFLALSAALSVTSTLQGVVAFAAAALFMWVYFQDMARPLVLPHARQNTLAVLAQLPALPFQCYGIWLLNARFDDPAMVWTGFFTCAAASVWMYFALTRWPLDLVESSATGAPLGWTPPRHFYTPLRVSLITGLAAMSAVAACLAVYVFPGDHAGLSVAAGFLAMILLIGTFPWIPSGMAFRPHTPPVQAAGWALASSAVAFALGAHGQDLIERGDVNGGLWFFLAGGTALVLGMSRFAADPGRAEAVEAGSWPRWEMAAVVLLAAAAFCMRIWKVESFPFGAEGDEAGGGLWALNILSGHVENHFIDQNCPLAFFSVTALFFKLWGISLETLRLHSVLFGTLSVFTTYFFLRLNMGRSAAFLATLLMSFSYWHLHYSRFGHYNIDQVAAQMAAFYFVFKAFRTGKLWQWAVGGLAFGLAMFPHMAGRILPFEGLSLVLYFFAARRDLLRRHLPGFLAFVAIVWAVSSPAIVYWRRAQSVSMSRIDHVSIFAKNNTNAPIDTLSGFVSNCRVSMLMFNDQGDNRPRDNPVAPDKILEHWTAILFGLAFIYLLYHWREPVNFFLLAVFFLNLCASVFSVEAPQTLRTAGNIPIVFAFMAVPLADLGAAVRRAGRGPARAVFLCLLAAFAFFCWRSARRLFVDQRGMAFDSAATYIAQTAGHEGGPDTQAVFWCTGFASTHPPVLLFKQATPMRSFCGPFEYLPITSATGQDNLLFLVDDYQQMLPYLQWIYPGAPVRPIPDQNGEPLALYVRVNRPVIARSEGLDGRALIGGRSVAVEGVGPDWPSAGLEQAREISVAGSLSVDFYGTYGLDVGGSGDASVRVDGRLLFSRRGGSVQRHSALLAKGLHELALRLAPASPGDVMRLRLESLKPGPVGSPWSLATVGTGDVDMGHLLRLRPSGFFGEYFDTLVPKGQPLFEGVEPIVLDHWLDSPLLGDWSARWRTRFKAPVTGDYRFSVNGGDYTQVSVDSKLVWRLGQPPDGALQPPPVLPSIRLTKGWHAYEAEFSTNGPPACDLDWTTPDGKTSVFWVPDMQPVP